MKYAIIENEYLSLESLRKKIEMIRPDYEIVFTAESVEDSVEYFNGSPDVELVFMDIELVDGNCFDIFAKADIRSYIIFTTAYDDYAIQAFKVNSIDYLLKPITEQDIINAIDKFERMHGKRQIDYSNIGGMIMNRKPRRRFLLLSGDKYSYAEIQDVAFFISEDKYIYAVLKSGRRRMTEFKNLSETEGLLADADFFQVSRNIIASITSVNSVSRYFSGRLRVIVKAGDEQHEIIVSAARRKQFLDWLDDNNER